MTRVSVVVRTRNEAARLRLTLASLAAQRDPAEIVVVNDGAVDGTAAVLAAPAPGLDLRVVTHATPQGRAAAANAGAFAATGEILLFLDGDTLAAPDLVARHRAAHQAGPGRIGRGETFHLRSTRFLQDPETGAPQPEHAARLAALPPAERQRMRVTRAEVAADFASIAARSLPGIYPGAAPRRLYELEMDAQLHHPACPVLWAAASGSNLSVPRDLFLSAGGFDPALDMNEHRELALRLCRRGVRMVAVPGAQTIHLTHRAGWRDPLRHRMWEAQFRRMHDEAAVPLLVLFWATLSGIPAVPPEARIASLPALALAARDPGPVDYAAARRALFAHLDASETAAP